MPRRYIDCREFPSDSKCSVAISADNDAELIDAAAQHAVAIHGHQDSPAMRSELRKLFKDGNPPPQAGMR